MTLNFDDIPVTNKAKSKEEGQKPSLTFEDIPGEDGEVITAPPSENYNFIEETKKDFAKRVQNIQDIDKREKLGSIYGEPMLPLAPAAQGLWQGTNVGLDTAFNVLQEGFDDVKRISNFVAPETSKMVDEWATNQWEAFKQTPMYEQGMRAMAYGLEAYDAWASQHPDAAKNMEAAIGLGFVWTPRSALKKHGLSKLGRRITASGKKSLLARKKKWVQELVEPVKTEPVLKAEMTRTAEKGILLRHKQPVPTKRVQEVMDEVMKIKGLRRVGLTTLTSYNKNGNIVWKALVKKADDLYKNLKIKNVTSSLDDVVEEMSKAKTKLKENAFLTKQWGSVETFLKEYEKRILQIANPDGTIPAHKLLRTRQFMDRYIARHIPQGEKIFDIEGTQTALKVSIREFRTAVNESIHKAARKKGLDSRASLKSQNLLYEAVDNISDKAAAEARNNVARALDVLKNVGTMRSKAAVGTAVVTGTSILAASQALPGILNTIIPSSLFVYTSGKVMMSPHTRKALGALVTTLGESGLKAEKAAIIDIINNIEVMDPSEFEIEAASVPSMTEDEQNNLINQWQGVGQ
jgi:hypothetical protein